MASRTPAPRFLDLGALEIERAGITHRPGGAALGRLLSRLLISHGYRVETDELVDAVWGDRATAASVSTLVLAESAVTSQGLWTLRRACAVCEVG